MTEARYESAEESTGSSVIPYVQPQLYGLNAAGVPAKRKRVAKPKAQAVAARTPDGDGPFDLVDAWATWMQTQTGIEPPRMMRDRLMAEIKQLIHEGYGSSDLRWALAIWSTKLAQNLNTSPKELAKVAWMYRMDTSQRAETWRQRMRQSAREMGKNGVSPSALNSSPAQQKTQATKNAASSWVERQRQREEQAK